MSTELRAQLCVIVASLCLTAHVWGTQAEFKPAMSRPLPTEVAYPIAADFNHDGILDIAMLKGDNNYSSAEVMVLIGTGGGHFLSPTYSPSVTGRCTGLISGDFNNDGSLDVAVNNMSGVSVWLGNGDGTFQTAMTYPVPVYGQGLVSGDFNQDGAIDLAVAGAAAPSRGAVAILFGHGDGTFAEPQLYPVGTGAQNIASGDLNGDGALDFVVSHAQENSVAVLLNNGDGTFNMVQQEVLAANVGWLTLGDVNGDGRLDLLTGLSNFTVGAALGVGQGNFQRSKTIAVGELGLPALSDFNRDGFLDLALTDEVSNIAVLLGDGNGASFAAPALYSTGLFPFSVVAADLDGDGYSDLVTVATDSLELDIFLNAGAGLPVTLSPIALKFAAQTVGTTSPPQTFKLTNTSTSNLTISSVIVSGDFLVNNKCASTIAPSGSCNMAIRFRPRATGTRKGVVTITDNAPSSPQRIQLIGIGH